MARFQRRSSKLALSLALDRHVDFSEMRSVVHDIVSIRPEKSDELICEIWKVRKYQICLGFTRGLCLVDGCSSQLSLTLSSSNVLSVVGEGFATGSL